MIKRSTAPARDETATRQTDRVGCRSDGLVFWRSWPRSITVEVATGVLEASRFRCLSCLELTQASTMETEIDG